MKNKYLKFEEDNNEWLRDKFIRENEVDAKISWVDFVDREYVKSEKQNFEVDR